MLLKRTECVQCCSEAEATNVVNYLFFEDGKETSSHYCLLDGPQYVFIPQHGDGIAVPEALMIKRSFYTRNLYSVSRVKTQDFL